MSETLYPPNPNGTKAVPSVCRCREQTAGLCPACALRQRYDLMPATKWFRTAHEGRSLGFVEREA